MQFVTVRLGRAKRAYTYQNDGEPVEAGAGVKVPAKTGEGWIRGTVVEAGVPAPSFECKSILGRIDDGELPGLSAEKPAAELGPEPAAEPAVDPPSGDAPAPAGHNKPPPWDAKAVEDFWKRTRKLADEAGAEAEKGSIEDRARAEKVHDTFNGLRSLHGQVEKKREADKKPLLQAGRDLDKTYNSIKAALDTAGQKLRKLLNEFADRQAEEERKRKAEAEAEAHRLAEEARQQAAKAAARHDAIGEAEAAQRAKEAQTALKEAARTPTTGRIGSASGGGKTTSLRTYYQAEIENPRRAFLALFDSYSRELTAELERLANDMMRHAPDKKSVAIPGVKFHEKKEIA